jgi:hypothetical protein
MNALRAFSANKLGASHPYDRERWLRFLIRAHMDHVELDATTLSRWFIEEEHWDEDRAHDLAIQFDFARELLSLTLANFDRAHRLREIRNIGSFSTIS